MARKLSFALIVLFWLTMNALLWRSEFAGKDNGAEVPVSLIWEKILTSPDDSALAVNHAGNRVGYIRWTPNVGKEVATGKIADESDLGRVQHLDGYTIHADGNFVLPDSFGRIRFEVNAEFDARHRWAKWTFRGAQRPNSWTIAADRETQTVRFGVGENVAPTQTFKFSDFRNPGKLLDDLGVSAVLPLAGVALPSLAPLSIETNSPALALGLSWQGRQEWLKIGHSRVKVYELRATFFEGYEVVIIVSRVGEILRVTLPNETTLVNEALINL